MNKKPAVAAKTARKTKLSRSQVEMARSMGVSIEDAAKANLPKRGRPAGSKNKPKIEDPFENEFYAWARKADAKYTAVDWEKLAKQLQAALAAEIKENDELKAELQRKRTAWERLVCLSTGAV